VIASKNTKIWGAESLGPVLTPWHKFNASDLEKVIYDVTRHHSETVDEIEGGVQYPSHEDLCKT
jgi:hypothetical protein